MTTHIRITVDDRRLEVPEGTSVAAAILIAGRSAFRTSLTGEPRGPLCGMGICFECRAWIEPEGESRTCTRTCSDGLVIRTSHG